MTIRTDQIKAGTTYRFFGSTGREIKPRRVTHYDPNGKYAGGTVRTCYTNGLGYEAMAGDYFAKHAEFFADGVSEDGK